MQATDGNLYGTTEMGGANLGGTAFRLNVGLGPFVQPQTTSGSVGTVVRILGTDLTRVSQVAFNGTSATFTEVSKSEVRATVPSGATTGIVTVTTHSGVLSSNQPFTVLD